MKIGLDVCVFVCIKRLEFNISNLELNEVVLWTNNEPINNSQLKMLSYTNRVKLQPD